MTAYDRWLTTQWGFDTDDEDGREPMDELEVPDWDDQYLVAEAQYELENELG